MMIWLTGRGGSGDVELAPDVIARSCCCRRLEYKSYGLAGNMAGLKTELMGASPRSRSMENPLWATGVGFNNVGCVGFRKPGYGYL